MKRLILWPLLLAASSCGEEGGTSKDAVTQGPSSEPSTSDSASTPDGANPPPVDGAPNPASPRPTSPLEPPPPSNPAVQPAPEAPEPEPMPSPAPQQPFEPEPSVASGGANDPGGAGEGGRTVEATAGTSSRGGSPSSSGGETSSGGATANGGESTSGAAGAPATPSGCEDGPLDGPIPGCEPQFDETGDFYVDCVARINQLRWECQCLPPLERWEEGEDCANQQAQYDYEHDEAHAGISARICEPSNASQNECPDYNPNFDIVNFCLQQMWDEGPGEPYIAHGHYINMSDPNITKVACGLYITPEGNFWSVQNFSR